MINALSATHVDDAGAKSAAWRGVATSRDPMKQARRAAATATTTARQGMAPQRWAGTGRRAVMPIDTAWHYAASIGPCVGRHLGTPARHGSVAVPMPCRAARLAIYRDEEEQYWYNRAGGLVVVRGARPCDELYVVAEGETLHSISARCGDPYILEHNPHVHDPDNVVPGLIIKITPRATAKSNSNSGDGGGANK